MWNNSADCRRLAVVHAADLGEQVEPLFGRRLACEGSAGSY
jgi:hypothetical protein